MKVAALQHDIVWEDREANFARLAPMIAGAAAAGARLVVLTEMFSYGFSLDAERITETPGGPSTRFLRETAARADIWLCGSIPILTPGDPRPCNRLVLAGPRGELGSYAKIHPFSYGDEHLVYDAGDKTVTVQVDDLRVSLFVCYDLRFATEFWSVAHDTDLYLVPANWPRPRRTHWQSLLVARAVENQAYVVGVNRVGSGGGLDYAGDSRIVDPMGEILAGGADVEATLIAEVDRARVTQTRERFPFLQDRL
ncbi:MAG: carbon-nitrogen family hydrolase [bacterium]|nr:carbon-nitrogen family hydrolase [bacterium]